MKIAACMLSVLVLMADGPRAVIYNGDTTPSNCTPTFDNG